MCQLQGGSHLRGSKSLAEAIDYAEYLAAPFTLFFPFRERQSQD